MNCGESYCTVCRLTSNLLWHYLVKFSCPRHYGAVIKFRSDAELFTVNIYRDVIFFVVCLFTILQHVFKLSIICRYVLLTSAHDLSVDAS